MSYLKNSFKLLYMKETIVMSVDASKGGLGAGLLQKNQPACYAAKAITKTELRYARIQKELYACVFACEWFYEYIHGRTDITRQTDSTPFVPII